MEAGIDAGGLFKELLTDVARAVFDPERGLFSSTADGFIYPALQASYLPDGLRLLEFAGLIVGKARGHSIPMAVVSCVVGGLRAR